MEKKCRFEKMEVISDFLFIIASLQPVHWWDGGKGATDKRKVMEKKGTMKRNDRERKWWATDDREKSLPKEEKSWRKWREQVPIWVEWEGRDMRERSRGEKQKTTVHGCSFPSSLLKVSDSQRSWEWKKKGGGDKKQQAECMEERYVLRWKGDRWKEGLNMGRRCMFSP